METLKLLHVKTTNSIRNSGNSAGDQEKKLSQPSRRRTTTATITTNKQFCEFNKS